MKLRLPRTLALQIGLLALLIICIAQVVFWVFNEGYYTKNVEKQEIEVYGRQADVANRLLGEGMSADDIERIFPDLTRKADGSGFEVSAEILAGLADERWHRMNRYMWEGGFFLLVLIVGIAVLVGALHQEYQLRMRQQNFLAAVSHEFKTPIASMRLSAETLSMRNPPNEKRQQLVARLLEDLDRLQGMVHNLFDAAKIEQARLEYHQQRLDLGLAVFGALRKIQNPHRENGPAVDVDVEEGLVVLADPFFVETILDNLLDNALKATAQKEKPRISIRGLKDGEFARVDVTDNGIGFPGKDAGKLFEKFYRVGNEMRREVRGAGLGLYIVSRFAERGGGRVWASSKGPGEGATFSVTWPLPPGEGSAT